MTIYGSRNCGWDLCEKAWADVISMRLLIMSYLMRQMCLRQGLGRCDSNESFNYVLSEVSVVSEVLESRPGEK